MTTDPMTQALSSATPTSAASTTSKAAGQMLGKDDFLKLLVGQLQHQDPLAPTDDQQWIGQMAQFSQLEQVTNTASSTDRIAASLDRTANLALIGRTVTYTDASGNPVSGVVQLVDMTGDGKASLTVDGRTGIDAASVTQVR